MRVAYGIKKGKWLKDLNKLRTIAFLLAEADTILVEHDEKHESFAIPSFGFFDALELLGEEEWEKAHKIYDGNTFTETQKYMYYLIVGQLIEYYNQKVIETSMDSTAKAAVTKLNNYRLSLGILPYEHDPQLTDAVQGHMEDIASGATKFGHMSSVPGKRTPQDRTKAAGFVGRTGENLATPGPDFSIDGWFWDGGHGRNNVNPKFNKVGLGYNGAGSGINNGWADTTVVVRPKAPFEDVEAATPKKQDPSQQGFRRIQRR
jgi:uncharacterized protein YkwD